MLRSHNQSKIIQGAEEKQALRDFAILYQYASALPFLYGEEMKRFTETAKWDDPWYRKLSCKHKAFWQYICDKCDNAGVWKIDYELASFQIGENVCEADIKNLNDGKERLVIKGGVLAIKDFIPFQIGKLTGNGLTNLQHNCLRLIDDYKKKGLPLTGKLRVSYPKGTGIGKGNSKGKDISKDIIRDIIDDLNSILKTSYKTSSNKICELIRARLAEGHTIADFKVVHRKMAKAWGVDNKMRQYLRPQTLYSNKFDSYLNRPEDLRMGVAGAKTLAAGQEWIAEKEKEDAGQEQLH